MTNEKAKEILERFRDCNEIRLELQELRAIQTAINALDNKNSIENFTNWLVDNEILCSYKMKKLIRDYNGIN